MGTTVATNALLERTSTKCALVVTKGFRDLLRIGDQTRPKLFDLNIRRPETLFDHVLEIDERVTLHDSTEDKSSLRDPDRASYQLEKGVGGEAIRVLQPVGEQNRCSELYHHSRSEQIVHMPEKACKGFSTRVCDPWP
jgi:5-oxoprolinase (ATP-hydrolysing)